jgi:hypothetical protein
MNKLTAIELSSVIKGTSLNEDHFMVLVDTTNDEVIQNNLGMKNIFRINKNDEIVWQICIEDSNKSNLEDTFLYIDMLNEN